MILPMSRWADEKINRCEGTDADIAAAADDDAADDAADVDADAGADADADAPFCTYLWHKMV